MFRVRVFKKMGAAIGRCLFFRVGQMSQSVFLKFTNPGFLPATGFPLNGPQRSKRALQPDGVPSSATGKVERGEARVAGSERLGRRAGIRYAALGTELAAYTLTFAGVGFAVDKACGNQKYYATALGTLIGFAYGMYQFVSEVQRGAGGNP